MKRVNKYNMSKCTPCQSVKCFFKADCRKCPASGFNEYMSEDERNDWWSKTHKPITEKIAHERDSGMGLDPLFFSSNNINPDKIVEWEVRDS